MTISFLTTKVFSILLCCIILFNAYLFKVYLKTWLCPACLFSLSWFLFTFFPLIVLIDVPISPYSIFYILICTMLFSSSSLLFNWKKAFQLNHIKLKLGGSKVFNTPFLKGVFISSQVYALISIIINLNINSIELNSYITNFFQTTHAYLLLRYSGAVIKNSYFQIGIVCNYLGIVIGGLLLVSCRKKADYTMLFILSFLPSVLFMLCFADKGTLFLGIALFYGGVLISRIHNNNFNLLTPKTKLLILGSILVIFPLLVLAFIGRGSYKLSAEEILIVLKRYFASYALGHIYAFSDWFTSYFFNDSLITTYNGYQGTLGFYTFTPIFNMLESSLEQIPGVYSEYFNYQGIFVTNIYTMFRGLILDYGLIGSLIFIYTAGLLANLAYYFMLVTKRPYISSSFFILMVGACYSSYIVSFFIWKSIYALGALLILVLFLNKIKLKWSHNNYIDMIKARK